MKNRNRRKETLELSSSSARGETHDSGITDKAGYAVLKDQEQIVKGERPSTTVYAIKMIDSNLKLGFVGAAVVVASNYVQLRLGTILADVILKKTSGGKWLETSALFRDAQPRNLLDKALDKGKLSEKEHAKLNQLFNIRNNAAHKTDLWRRPDKKNKALRAEAKKLCKVAEEFLSRTNQAD
jgi:hypothetical protein